MVSKLADNWNTKAKKENVAYTEQPRQTSNAGGAATWRF
jgi:hypothetical protein